jgi:hypothetical protein
LSSINTLATITVNGQTITAGSTFTVAARTSLVAVSAVTTDAAATYTVSGTTNLVSGNNTVTIRVVAANGDARNVTFTVYVTPLSSNTNLSVFTVAGQTATNGATITVGKSTTSVSVIAVAADAEATAVAAGFNALREGNNPVTVTVTAADGTVRTYEVNVYVTPLSSNTDISNVSINGQTVAAGGTVTVATGTTAVSVAAAAFDSTSTVAVIGRTGLVSGNNVVTVRVTAENG